MNTMNLIKEYINNIPLQEPIYSNKIYDYVLKKIKTSKLVINEYINRYEEQNEDFIRYRKGIYFKTDKTPFGYAPINYQKLINDLYIKKSDEIIGYISGPTFANKIGLTTLLPKYEYITTNNNRVISDVINLKLVKPVTKITSNNYKYLQILDLINNKHHIQYDCDNPNRLIYDYIKKNNLQFSVLLYYSKYYKKDILVKLQEISANYELAS